MAPAFALKEWEDNRGGITWATRETYEAMWPHCWCGLFANKCEGLKKEEAWMWEREQ